MRWKHVTALALGTIATSQTIEPNIEQGSDVAIAHVAVVDVATGSARSDQTVLIRGPRIVSVQPSKDARPPSARRSRATRDLDSRGCGLRDDEYRACRDGDARDGHCCVSVRSRAFAELKLERERGTIATGMAADLVLLDANPLADIDNVRRVRAVVVMGRVLQRADLDRILASVAAQVHTRTGCAGS